MTELSAAELATVERFERAPDALRSDRILCGCSHGLQWHHDERGCQYHGNGPDRCRCLRDIDTAAEDSPWLARMVAEAADAREAEVRERVEAVERRWSEALDDGCPSCGPVGFTGCDHIEGYHHALSDLRAALAPADNDGGVP